MSQEDVLTVGPCNLCGFFNRESGHGDERDNTGECRREPVPLRKWLWDWCGRWTCKSRFHFMTEDGEVITPPARVVELSGEALRAKVFNDEAMPSLSSFEARALRAIKGLGGRAVASKVGSRLDKGEQAVRRVLNALVEKGLLFHRSQGDYVLTDAAREVLV